MFSAANLRPSLTFRPWAVSCAKKNPYARTPQGLFYVAWRSRSRSVVLQFFFLTVWMDERARGVKQKKRTHTGARVPNRITVYVLRCLHTITVYYYDTITDAWLANRRNQTGRACEIQWVAKRKTQFIIFVLNAPRRTLGSSVCSVLGYAGIVLRTIIDRRVARIDGFRDGEHCIYIWYLL